MNLGHLIETILNTDKILDKEMGPLSSFSHQFTAMCVLQPSHLLPELFFGACFVLQCWEALTHAKHTLFTEIHPKPHSTLKEILHIRSYSTFKP